MIEITYDKSQMVTKWNCMMAIPYEQYIEEEWPEWMISAGKETA